MAGRLEAEVKREVLLRCSDLVRFYNNPVGVAVMPNGARVVFGVGGVGGADLVGIVRSTGQFIACELKREIGGRVSPEQVQFLEGVRQAGGIAVVARSADDVLAAVAGSVGAVPASIHER